MVFFDTDQKPYNNIWSKCQCELKFLYNADRDTDLAEKVKNTQPYDPTKDPNSPYYIPVVECPYCHSTDTKKITNTSKAVHTAVFGIFSIGRNSKNFHCNKCGSDF